MINVYCLLDCRKVIKHIRSLTTVPKTLTNVPIVVVNGNTKPRFVGHSYCYKTKGGKIIHHPNAYNKKGWSNMIYYPATYRIEVGELWLKKQNYDVKNSLEYLRNELWDLFRKDIVYERSTLSYYIFDCAKFESEYNFKSVNEIKKIARKLIDLKVFQ